MTADPLVPVALYAPIVTDLPAVYFEDRASLAQLEAYLGLVDELNRGAAERLEHLAAWLGPDATDRLPSTLPAATDGDTVLAEYHRVFDELAHWFAFAAPASWGSPDGGAWRSAASLDIKRRFLLRAARLWRRRGTPQGFVEWVCFAFDISDVDRPWLFEHFKYETTSAGTTVAPTPTELTATLVVPDADQFRDYARRRELIEFVDAFAPAHVFVRVCFVDPATAPPEPANPGAPSAADLDQLAADTTTWLCTLDNDIPHSLAITALRCAADGDPQDHLDLGWLPSD